MNNTPCILSAVECGLGEAEAKVVFHRAFSTPIPQWLYRDDEDGYRVISVSGMLVPYGVEDMPVTGYDWILDAIGNADRVRLYIDSGGGILHQSLERVMRKLQSIDSEAIVNGMCASAAYLLGRSCRRMYAAGRTAEIGGLGAFILVYDFSKANEELGWKPIKIKIGKYKAIGAGGEYTNEELAELQRHLEEMYFEYVNVLGRNIPEEMHDGRVWGAVNALNFGLIDGILSGWIDEPDDAVEVTDVNNEGIDMSGENNDVIIREEENEKVEETVVEASNDGGCCEAAVESCVETAVEVNEPANDAVAETEEPKVEVKKLPVRRVSDDGGEEKLFERLYKQTGSRAQAWVMLERINPEAYMRLRNKTR